MSEPRRDPVATAQGLTDAVTALAGEVENLRRYGHHNRTFIIVDILLTILLSGVGGLAVHAVQSAGQANTAQHALCEAGNEARAQQIGLWEYLIRRSPPPATAQARKNLVLFEQHLHIVFAPRDCTALGR